MKVLFVDDDPHIRFLMSKFAERLKLEADYAEDGLQALEKLQGFRADTVVTDVDMPRMDGLKLLAAIRQKYPDTIVIIVTGRGTETVAAEALRLGANNYITKPFDLRAFNSVLEKYAQTTELRTLDGEFRQTQMYHEAIYEIDNRVERIPHFADWLGQTAGWHFSQEQRAGVRLGLTELLMNAVEHGNLGIGYARKSEALDSGRQALEAIYRERLADPARAARKVQVHFHFDGHCCRWTIHDDGDGFDWHNVPDPLDPANEFKEFGRGIFLSRFNFDSLEYNQKGNEVAITKKIARPPAET